MCAPVPAEAGAHETPRFNRQSDKSGALPRHQGSAPVSCPITSQESMAESGEIDVRPP